MMENRTLRIDSGAASAHSKSNRRPYSAPKLTQTGSIPEITGGPSGGTIDTLAGGTGGFQTSTS